jgi:hypothetical protein
MGGGANSGLALEVSSHPLVRYDKKATNYLGLIKVACILLWYRRQHRLFLLR